MLSQTKYKLKRTPERVNITRLHHPLVGLRLEVLMEAGEHIVVRLPDGSPMRIPRGWTDADGTAAGTRPAGTGVLSVDSLRELFRVLDGLRREP